MHAFQTVRPTIIALAVATLLAAVSTVASAADAPRPSAPQGSAVCKSTVREDGSIKVHCVVTFEAR